MHVFYRGRKGHGKLVNVLSIDLFLFNIFKLQADGKNYRELTP